MAAPDDKSPRSSLDVGERMKPVKAPLRAWHRHHYRRFPWRAKDCDPFKLLVAEALLRKTRAESVAPIWNELVLKYPTPAALASADLAELQSILQPLGLHRMRARALITIAERLEQAHSGNVPEDADDLVAMPHFGRYGANAVLCFGFGWQVGLVDSNIARIISRVFSLPVPVELHKADDLWQVAHELAKTGDAREVNLSLLDLGALVCTSRRPRCSECPLVGACDHSARSTTERTH